MSNTKKITKKPLDHLPAAKDEQAGEMVEVEFDGHTFTIASDPMDWPGDALVAFEAGRAVTGIKALVGARFDMLGMGRWTGRKINALMEQFAEEAGLTAGN